jgi:hypothetical protein
VFEEPGLKNEVVFTAGETVSCGGVVDLVDECVGQKGTEGGVDGGGAERGLKKRSGAFCREVQGCVCRGESASGIWKAHLT